MFTTLLYNPQLLPTASTICAVRSTTDLVKVYDVDDPVAQVCRCSRFCLHYGVSEVRLEQQRIHALDYFLRRKGESSD